MAEADDLIGKWAFVSSENFDEFLKAIGVGFATRKLANSSKPDFFVTKEGDSYSWRTVSLVKTTNITFKVGEEFDETRADGSKVKSTITFEDGKWIHKQETEVPCTITREVKGDEMIVTSEAKDVKSVRKYKKADK